MKNKIRKILSCLLAVIMLLTAAPLSGFVGLKLDLPSFGIEASAASLPSSGKCGENATYTFNEALGLLTISGTGAIDSSAFEMHTEIRSVVIENGITEIGDSAFNACVNIFEIKIPDSVTKIGKYIFDGCSGPLSITIPTSVTSIGDNAFGSQKIFVHKGSYAEQYASENSLNYVTLEVIPDGVDYVENQVVYYFNWHIDKATETLTFTHKYSGQTFTGDAPWLPYKEYIKHVVVDDITTFIDPRSFAYCDRIEDVSLPSNFKKIDKDAFYGCSSLKSINLPETLTVINYGAFYGCSGLTDVVVPDGVSFGSKVFYNCSNLKTAVLPQDKDSIPSHLFYGCSQLTNISFPANTSMIGDYAFANCKAFTALLLPDSVTSIGSHAFDGCTNVKELTVPCSAVLSKDGYAFGGCTNIEKITITAGTGTMQDFGSQGQNKIAIYNNTPWYINREHLKELTIADGITNIGDYAFCGFDKASQLAIPQTVTKIGASAFENCSELTSLEIPEGVTSIGKAAFSGCSKLASVNIPKDITSIEASTFNGCTALTEITIPSGVTSIGASAFSGCSGLAALDIPTGVTAIGEAAFSGCSGIKKFTIPSGVTKIENSVFSGCSSLSDINIHSGITSIGDNAFNGCSDLKSIELLYNVDSIGASAFAGCSGLDSLTVYNRKCAFGENSVAPNTTVYGFSYSTAETYANSNGNKFVSLDAMHVHEYDYECDRICNICGFERDVDHAYDSACDDTCNYCGQKRKAPHVDDDVNYYCDVCGAYLLDIAIGEKKEVYVNAGEIVYLKFSPPYSGKFDFYSSASPNGTVGYICDSEKNVLTRKEGYWETDDFYIETVLTKGKVYYLGVQFYDKETSGTIPVTLSFNDEDHLSTHIEHKDSTCTEHGYDRVICDYCGKVISETELPFAHQYTSVVTPSTCSEQGYTTYTCSLCSYSYKDNYTEALNHPTRSWHIEKNPTTSEEGLMVETCDLCSAKTSEMTIPKLRPDFVTGIELTPNKISMNIGETANITAVVTPTTAIDKSVIWSSSDNDIVSVDGGVVTAKALGVAVITAETTDGGYKDFCIVRVASIVGTNGAVVDNENGVIYGFVGCPESIDGYVKTVDSSLSVQCDSKALGTGSVVSVLNGTKTVDSYKIVIFGDVDGDGRYDGRDAVTVSMLANGMLTREQVGEAAWIAADCNHDGIIDQLDVEILNQAGVLLSKVDQTKPTEELLETSAEYNEYLSLIDQMNTEPEKPNDEPTEDDGFFAKLVSFIKKIIKFIVDGISKLFKF